MAKSNVDVSSIRSNGLVVVDAANSRAPALPSTSNAICPTWVTPLKKTAVIGNRPIGAGWASRPNVNSGLSVVIISEVKASVQRTRGVALSVSGGDPQLDQVVGVVNATIGMSKDAVTPAPVSEVTALKSGSVMGSRLVPARYAALGCVIGIKS